MRLKLFVAVIWCLALVPVGSNADPYLDPDGIEVVLSQTISDKAADLGNDPVRIYEFVRNELNHELYYGMLKGPEGALLSGGGNDYDLSALLVSLLRSSGIRARFVRGRIKVPEADALSWTGALNPTAAVAMLQEVQPIAWLGIPHLDVAASGGFIELMHIWVEAEVPMAAYRGAGPDPQSRGLTWVPLAPAFKLKNWNPAPSPPLPIGTPALEFDYFGPDGLYAKVRSKLPGEIFEDQLREYLADQTPSGVPPSVDEIAALHQVRKQYSGVLPNRLPFDLSALLTEARAAGLNVLHRDAQSGGSGPPGGGTGTHDYHYQLRVYACVEGTSDCANQPQTNPNKLIDHGTHNTTSNTAGWDGKRLAIGFPFVNQANVPSDWHTSDPAPCDGISGQPLQVRPAFLVDGVEVTPTNLNTIDVCTSVDIYLFLALPFRSPSGSTQDGLAYGHIGYAVHTVGAEGVYVVALGTESYSAARVTQLADTLAEAVAQHPLALDSSTGATFVDSDPNGAALPTNANGTKDANEIFLAEDFALRESLVGGLLHLGSAFFFEGNQRNSERISAIHQQVRTNTPGLGLVSSGRTVESLEDIPFGLAASNLLIDVKVRPNRSLDRSTGESAGIDHAFILDAHQLSALEHTAWEELSGGEAISTVKGLQLGAETGGRRVLQLTDSNYNDHCLDVILGPPFEILATCDSATFDLYESFFGDPNTGTQTLPGTELRVLDVSAFSYFDWTGSVYVIIEPNGVGVIIEGSAGGGELVGPRFDVFDPSSYLAFLGLPSSPAQLAAELVGFTAETAHAIAVFVEGAATAEANLVTFGDPVSVTHGHYFESNTDVHIAGPAGMGLRLVRSYNSKLDFAGPFGHGWSTTFDQHLRADEGDVAVTGDERVLWVTEGGSEEAWDDDGTLLTPQLWNHDSLVRETNNMFTLTTKEGVVYRFDVVDSVTEMARLLTISDRNGNTLTCNYAPSGELASVSDATGVSSRKLDFFYDGAGKIDRLEDWTGRTWEYEVDANGDLVSYMDPEEVAKGPGLGRAWTYEYLSGMGVAKLNHNLIRFRRPADRDGDPAAEGDYSMEFAYHPNDTVYRHTDSFGRNSYFSYNRLRRRSTITHPDGALEHYFYDAYGNTTRHEDSRGAITEWSFDAARKDQVEEIDALGFKTTAVYDNAGNVIKRTDRLGNTERWSWNSFGQPLVHEDFRGNTQRWTYSPEGNLLSTQAELDGQLVTLEEFEYDSHGNAIRSISHLGDGRTTTTRVLFDANGVAVEQIVDAHGNAVRFSNDTLGRPTRAETDRTVELGGTERRLPVAAETKYDRLDRAFEVADPGGVIARTVFDSNGLPLAISRLVPDLASPQLVEQVVQQFRYDAMDRLIEVENALGEITQAEYDDRDRPVLVRSPLGREVRTAYDIAGNPVLAVDPAGQTTRTEFDLLGRPVRTVDALGRESTTAFDAAGRLLEVIAPGGRTTFQNPIYDEAGNLLEVEDARNTRTVSIFDELGRVTSTTVAAGTADEAETLFEYDLAGRLIRKTDPASNAWAVSYDLLGLKTQESDPLGRTWSFRYDELGNLLEALDPAGYQVTSTYDVRGLRTERTDQVPGEAPRTLRSSYDALGRLVRSSLGAGTFTMRLEYDELDRVSARTFGNSTERYVFDDDGQLIQHVLPTNVLPGGGGVATFGYDARGLLSTVHDPEAGTWSFEYDALGRPVRQAGPIGDTRTVAYTPEGFIDRVDILVPGTVGEFAAYAGYDGVGNPASVTTTEGTTSLSHDTQSRVTGVTYPGAAGSEVFEYDVRGNRSRHVDRQGVARTYHYDLAQQLTEIKDEIGGTPFLQFGYDAAGRRIDRTEVGVGSTSYAYLGNGRLRAVTPAAGTPTFLVYGPDGRRILRVDGAGIAEYSYPQVEKRGGDTWRWAGPGSGAAAVRYTASGKRVVHSYADGSATVSGVAETDEGGVTLFEDPPRRLEMFGRVRSGASVVERGFASQQHEGAAGLVLMGARHYDPEVGGFLQVDPLGIASTEVYRYAGASPLRFADPSGFALVSIKDSVVEVLSHPVAQGTGQVLGGVAILGVAGAASPSCATVVACAGVGGLAVLGADQVSTGWSTLSTGVTQTSLYRSVLLQGVFGLSPRSASLFEAATIGAASFGAGYVPSSTRVVTGLADDVARGAPRRAPDFVVSPGGTAYPVPRGATGPVPVVNNAGNRTGTAFTGGKGGANQQVDAIRIMDPTPPRGASPGYPNGYITYQNARTPPQAVNPNTGRTVPPDQAHFPIDY